MQDFLKEKTVRGGVARLLSQAATFLLRIGSMAAMSRLLDPRDFGLVAMATVVTGVYGIFSSAGLSSATVQRETVTHEQVSTLFWINLAIGVFLALLTAATAPVLVSFYDEPRLLLVTIALAAGFIFNALGLQHLALLQREMRFSAMAIIEAVSLLTSIAIGIAMASAGCGYWSIIAATVSAPAISSACSWKATGWIPARPSMGSGVRSMLRFGGALTLHGFVFYITNNAEKLLLGRFWGPATVGLYVRAYYLINVPIENINSTVAAVAFSALARIQYDQERLRSYFLKGYKLILSMTVPITVTCAVFADDLIPFVLGPKWVQAAPVFRLMTPTVLIFGLLSPWVWLLQSIGLQNRALKIALCMCPVTVGGYLLGLPHAAVGVALGHCLAVVLTAVPVLCWSIRGTVFTTGDILRAVKKPFLAGAAAAAVSLLFRLGFDQMLSPFLRLAVGAFVMLASYLWMLLFVMGEKQFYLNIIRALRDPSSKPEAVSQEA